MENSKKSLPSLLPKPPNRLDSQSHDRAGALSSFGTTEPPHKRQVVTSACFNCRKQKSKCDGTRPQCASCVKKGAFCEYATPEGITPIQAGKQELAKYQGIYEVLKEGTLAESTQALDLIRAAADIDAAVVSIREARSLPLPNAFSTLDNHAVAWFPRLEYHEPQSEWLNPPFFDDPTFTFESTFKLDPSDPYVYNADMIVDLSMKRLPLSRWTTVSNDDRHMNHLLNLFFTWDTIAGQILYRPIFEEDVAALDPYSAAESPWIFCSRFIVNALLALSCLYTLDPLTFKHHDDPLSRGRWWAEEAEALLEKIDKPSITLLQGLYALFSYERNIGNGTKCTHYFRRAIGVYKALNCQSALQQRSRVDEPRQLHETFAISWCMWGVYCREWRTCHPFGIRKSARKPVATKAWRTIDFPLSRSDNIGYWWCSYPISLHLQRSMQVERREADIILTKIAEDALDFIYPEADKPPPQANSQYALELYDACVDWKLSCPGGLRFEETTLPSAILLHIDMEILITAILRLFSRIPRNQFGRFDPRERCFAHASSLMSAIWAFRSFAPLRFDSWMTFAMTTAAYIVLRDPEGSPIQIDTIIRACRCLDETRSFLPLATDALSGIRISFRRYGLQVPNYLSKYLEEVHHRRDGGMHHCMAALLPSSSETDDEADLRVGQILDEFDSLTVD